MPNVRSVLNTDGADISDLINAAAVEQGLDPVWLLALVLAESGLNPRAERWGRETAEAQAAIERQDWPTLTGIIGRAWPDISFGYSQRIVLYHDYGDRSPSVNNCLAVRDHVFANPAEDIDAAAARLAAGIARSNDGSVLGGMIVYNAGRDRRDDPAWLASWAGNVAAYERALETAQGYADAGPTPEEEWQNVHDVLNGIAGQLASFSAQLADVRDIVQRLRGGV